MQMKHGDKEKGKASKASKTSGKKVSKAGGAKVQASQSKGREAKAVRKTESREKSAAKAPAKAPTKTTGGKAGVKAGSGKASSPARAHEGNGSSRPRVEAGDVSFGNALVAAAFKRAIKKYNNAFRRLTD
jgi:hypothetical protein